MKMKMRRLLSLVLSIMMVFSVTMYSYAQENNLTRAAFSLLEDGITYQIVQEESMLVRNTYLYDSNGTLLQTLIFYKDSGVLTNPENGNSLYLSPTNAGPCTVSTNTDYEYEFCSLGSSVPREHEVTVGEIADMISTTTATLSAVKAVLGAIVGITVFTGSAKTLFEECADWVKEYLNSFVLDHIVHMYTYEVCTEQWESDSSYPNGGFYFLGYLPDNTRFSYEIV